MVAQEPVRQGCLDTLEFELFHPAAERLEAQGLLEARVLGSP